MTDVRITTPRLDLVLQTPDEVLARVAALPPAERAEVSPDWMARVRAASVGDPWVLTFNAIERTSGTAVAEGGFKGPPDAEAVVEIAYGTAEEHRGLGYATEIAAALTDFAFASGLVRVVRAHTKPDGVASARVLTKCGFRSVGDVIDPEDGLVCRWERRAETR